MCKRWVDPLSRMIKSLMVSLRNEKIPTIAPAINSDVAPMAMGSALTTTSVPWLLPSFAMRDASSLAIRDPCAEISPASSPELLRLSGSGGWWTDDTRFGTTKRETANVENCILEITGSDER